MAAHFKDSVEGWLPFRLGHIQSNAQTCLLTGWTHLSYYAKEAHFQPFLIEVWKFCLCLAMKIKFQSSVSGLTLRICYQMYLLKQEDPEVEHNQGSAADNLATIIPAGRDLEMQSSLSLGCGSSLMMTGFRVRYCALVSNCSWWQKSSALLYRNQSHDMVL